MFDRLTERARLVMKRAKEEAAKEVEETKAALDDRERQIEAAEKRLEKRAKSQGIGIHAPGADESLQKIIDTIAKLCGTKCMARAVAVRELRKFQGKEGA